MTKQYPCARWVAVKATMGVDIPYCDEHVETSVAGELLFAGTMGCVFTLALSAVVTLGCFLHFVLELSCLSIVGLVVLVLAPYYVRAALSDAHVTGKKFVPESRQSYGAAAIMNYFPIRYQLANPDMNLDPSDDGPPPQYLFAVHPHGIHTFSGASLVYSRGPLARIAPRVQRRLVGVVASILFYIPFAREVLLGSGYRDASRTTCERILREGNSIYLVTGGSAESIETEKGKDKVYLKRRLGFIRLAMKFGVPIVPCYAFGQNDVYDTAYTPFLSFRKWLIKKFQMCIPIFWGRWGTSIPYREKITVVLGEPVRFPPTAETVMEDGHVDPELVKKHHQRYIRALQDLFESNKAAAGYPPERKLEIL